MKQNALIGLAAVLAASGLATGCKDKEPAPAPAPKPTVAATATAAAPATAAPAPTAATKPAVAKKDPKALILGDWQGHGHLGKLPVPVSDISQLYLEVGKTKLRTKFPGVPLQTATYTVVRVEADKVWATSKAFKGEVGLEVTKDGKLHMSESSSDAEIILKHAEFDITKVGQAGGATKWYIPYWVIEYDEDVDWDLAAELSGGDESCGSDADCGPGFRCAIYRCPGCNRCEMITLTDESAAAAAEDEDKPLGNPDEPGVPPGDHLDPTPGDDDDDQP
jgi:hypothetical protein